MILGYQFSQNASSVIFEDEMIEVENIRDLGYKNLSSYVFLGNFS